MVHGPAGCSGTQGVGGLLAFPPIDGVAASSTMSQQVAHTVGGLLALSPIGGAAASSAMCQQVAQEVGGLRTSSQIAGALRQQVSRLPST